MADGWGDLFTKLGTAILGAVATALVTQGATRAFGPRQPRPRDIQQDIRMQRAEALQGQRESAQVQREFVEPIRTPEQTQADQMTLEATRQRMATFTQLSKEYAALKERGPIWDPFEETRLREEAMGEAAARGMAESGQAQEHVRRRLEESRIRRAGVHETALSNLRQQMTPYTAVQQPTQPPIFQPGIPPGATVNAAPRRIESPFRAAPFDIGAVMLPDRKKEEKPQSKATGFYG